MRDPAFLYRIIDEPGTALADFAETGSRHRGVRPANILLRTREPLDLVITGFGSARLSDFDLQAVAPLELTRHSAPEAIVSAVNAASDWWSLGMIVLEQATGGACFVGVNDQAFGLHVVTRGAMLPDDVEGGLRTLLRGLLARDPVNRPSNRGRLSILFCINPGQSRGVVRLPAIARPGLAAQGWCRAVQLRRCPPTRLVSCPALLQKARSRSVIAPSRERGETMSDFKGRHFEGEIVLWAVR